MVGRNFIMYKIRKAALEISRGIAEVQVDSYSTAYAAFFPKAYIDHFTYHEPEPGWIDLFKEETDDILLVALSTEGQVIGYTFARADAEIHPRYNSEVLALHVRKAYQRNGIGKGLLHKAVEELDNGEASPSCLDIERQSDPKVVRKSARQAHQREKLSGG